MKRYDLSAHCDAQHLKGCHHNSPEWPPGKGLCTCGAELRKQIVTLQARVRELEAENARLLDDGDGLTANVYKRAKQAEGRVRELSLELGKRCECRMGPKLDDDVVEWCAFHADIRDDLVAAQARVRELEALAEGMPHAVNCIVWQRDRQCDCTRSKLLALCKETETR